MDSASAIQSVSGYNTRRGVGGISEPGAGPGPTGGSEATARKERRDRLAAPITGKVGEPEHPAATPPHVPHLDNLESLRQDDGITDSGKHVVPIESPLVPKVPVQVTAKPTGASASSSSTSPSALQYYTL